MNGIGNAREFEVAPGTVFQGRYEVIAKLGEGGFSHVYRARQRMTGQDVAIKILQPRWAEDGTQLARFRREMQLCARLYHPNIVRLLDTGETEQRLLYTVFELVPGRTLAEVLTEEGGLTLRETVHLMEQVLDALVCAHQSGVIHRDLKPQNIMLTNAGVRRNALVLDFGLGTLTEEERRKDQARLTLTHEALGTPAYAAPEVLRGEEASVRSDLYAWALIVLECLTGRRVMDGHTLQEVLYKQLSSESVTLPEPLQGRRLGQLLERVLSKEVAARDVGAEELLLALEAWRLEGWEEQDATPIRQPPEQQRTVAAAPLAEGGRRQLTTLCLALSMSGPGLDAMDGEDVDRMLQSQHAASLRLARRFEAHVGGVLGDRVLLYFGYPRAREDDARRAARAALALASELEERAKELAERQRLTLQWRMGLHTGLVLDEEGSSSGRRTPLMGRVGLTPQLTTRIEELAEPGSIFVSEEAVRLLGSRFVLAPAGVHPMPGRSRPLAVMRLVEELRADNTPTPLDWQQRPLSGRTHELELMRTRWQQACRGQGQVVLLIGEPGIGKSRLVRELGRSLGEVHYTWLECRCAQESRHSTLQPVVDMLGRLLGLHQEPAARRQALEALLERLDMPKAESLSVLAPLLGLPLPEQATAPALPPQRLKELTLDTLVGLLGALAEERPLLLVVEDLHWADASTLELLGVLAEEVPTRNMYMLGTSRPELSPSWSGSHVLQVQLGRLEAAQVEQMVTELGGGRPLPQEVLAQIVQRADGVPLFIEELTRMVLESGVLKEHPSGWRLVAPLSTLSVPSTLRDLLMARLDRLGAAKETAQLAAALGREFSAELLRAISGREEAALQKDLSALVGSGMVYRRRGGRGTTYLFKHALVRDNAYESLSRSARRQVHARIAAVLESQFPELAESRPELISYHHAAAEQKRQALEYAQRAANAALRRSANQEALAHATAALEWLPALEDEHERARLELTLNGIITPALMAARGWSDEAIRLKVERSQQLIDLLGDSPHTQPSLWALYVYHHTRGSRRQARALVERIVALGGQEPSTDLVALLALGTCGWVEGQLDEAESQFRRVLTLYSPTQHGDHAYTYGMDTRVSACLNLALVEWLLGRPERARALQEQALLLARELNHASTTALAYMYSVYLQQFNAEGSQAKALLKPAQELVAQHHLIAYHAYLQMLEAWVDNDAPKLQGNLQALVGAGMEIGLTYYGGLLAEIELNQGRPAQALEHATHWVRQADSSGELYYQPELLRLQALSLEATGASPAESEHCLRKALELARAQRSRSLGLRVSNTLARQLLRQGRTDEARQLLTAGLQDLDEAAPLREVAEARALLSA